MKKRLLLVGAILLLAVPLAYLLLDVSQHVFVVRILHLVWRVRLLFESLPQTYLWTALVVIAALIVLRRFLARGQPHPPREDVAVQGPGRITTLTRQVQRARKSEYARRSLAREVRDLAVEVLAHERRMTSEQLRRDLRDGRLDLPPEVLSYLNLERWPTQRELPGFFTKLKRRLSWRPKASQPDYELRQVIEFLEAELRRGPQPEDRLKIGGSA
jgi:hypothetical protein